MNPYRLAALTVLSSQEDVTLSRIRDSFYLQKPDDCYLHLSAWNDSATLASVVQQQVVDIVGTEKAINRLDIVGHVLVDSARGPRGLIMGDTKEVKLGLDESGGLIGRDFLKVLFNFCVPELRLRVIMCRGQALGQDVWEKVLELARECGLAGVKLWVANVPVGGSRFGGGGYPVNNPDLYEFTGSRLSASPPAPSVSAAAIPTGTAI